MAALLCSGAWVFGRPADVTEASAASPIPIRDVRVRLAARVTRVRVRSDATIEIVLTGRSVGSTLPSGKWHVFTVHRGGGLGCEGRPLSAGSLALHTSEGAPLTVAAYRDSGWTPGFRYDGRLRVICRDDGRLDVINNVDVERYVASVVAHEVWPTFETQAYRAQAIVTRTYVLYTMTRRRSSSFDVEAGQGSQVYRGRRTDDVGRRATEAAQYTRGVVTIWRDGTDSQLFSAFYSAACGGLTQSGSVFGDEHGVRPLSGGVTCNYCRDAPGKTYRWGPVQIEKREVRRRLAARYRGLQHLGSIARIDVVERTPAGRPIHLKITDTQGQSYELASESFRIAVGADKMRSTDCTIRIRGRYVELTNGHGFGHGIGLCQWGAQGLAKRGRQAAEILRFYYPGSTLARVY